MDVDHAGPRWTTLDVDAVDQDKGVDQRHVLNMNCTVHRPRLTRVHLSRVVQFGPVWSTPGVHRPPSQDRLPRRSKASSLSSRHREATCFPARLEHAICTGSDDAHRR